MRGVLLAGLCALAVSGCVSNGGSSGQAGWAGRSLDAFVVANGPPSSSHPLRDGRRVVEWQDAMGAPASAVTTLGGASTMGGGAAQLSCRVRMTVGRSGVIETFNVVNDTVGMWTLSRCAEALKA